jgi:hypothetical protein
MIWHSLYIREVIYTFFSQKIVSNRKFKKGVHVNIYILPILHLGEIIVFEFLPYI